MTGRLSSSRASDDALVTPVVLTQNGVQTVAAIPGRFYNTHNVPLKVKRIDVAVGTAPTGAALTVDVKIDGTTVFAAAGDRATVAISGFTGTAVPTATDLDAIIVLPGHYVTANVAQIGSTVAGSDLVVQLTFGPATL